MTASGWRRRGGRGRRRRGGGRRRWGRGRSPLPRRGRRG
uniref:Uncharacterized protein n=1 Tax=Arundo donax TaxID=35708 RepID=A0A0A9F4A3_ARUDO